MADKRVSTESLAMDTGKPRYEGKKLRVAVYRSAAAGREVKID
jgi:hypothetical protein